MPAFVFPGQGSQKRGMGGALFDEIPQFRELEPDIDLILGYSIRTLCLEDPDDRLQQTAYTQPGLYVVNALYYYKAVADGQRADFLAGHSLGEYSALFAAGAFDFVTGLRLVRKRGELMAQAKNGGMAAVLGLEADRIAAVIEAHFPELDIANYNSPLQTVISGPSADIERAKPIMQEAGARMYVPLPVSAAFHSRYMAHASAAFEGFLAQFQFDELRIPVISNVTGQPYPSRDSSAVANLLVRQMNHSVRWRQSVRYLLDNGATAFKEIGPGAVLTGLIQQIRRQAS